MCKDKESEEMKPYYIVELQPGLFLSVCGVYRQSSPLIMYANTYSTSVAAKSVLENDRLLQRYQNARVLKVSFSEVEEEEGVK